MRKSHQKAPKLSVVTYAFVSLSAAVVGVLFLLLMRERLEVYQHATLASAIATRAKGVQTGLARALHEELSNMRHVAERLGGDEPQDMALKLKMVVGDGSRIYWGAFAGIDGRIQASADGLLVGEDASERSWFKEGLEGPYAGAVREDVTLPEGQDAPKRFISLSMPVRGSAGEIKGVLDLRLNFQWPIDYLSDMADALDIDMFLLSPKGEFIIASDGGSYGALDLPSVRAAQLGAKATNLERWPDGKLYFTYDSSRDRLSRSAEFRMEPDCTHSGRHNAGTGREPVRPDDLLSCKFRFDAFAADTYFRRILYPAVRNPGPHRAEDR